MELKATFQLAMRALARNKVRSALTMLGIIIGVGAVICAVAIGEGASLEVQEQISNLGDNMIWVEAGGRNVNGVRSGTRGTKTLTIADAKAIAAEIPQVKNISPNVDTSAQVIYEGKNWFTSLHGVSPEYLDVRKWKIESGSSFTDSDVERAANVCLLGHSVAQNLFGDEDPTGKTIRIKNLPCLVTGELAAKGLAGFGQDQDDIVIMPYTTVQRKIMGTDWLDDILCSADSPGSIEMVEQQISELLRERHKLRPDEADDFNLRHPGDIAQAQAQSQRIMTLLLAAIASVSLVVGGIGIMNIMLVSVTERTREIGVRMAVGATEKDVEMQFLSEALVLSVVGGIAGLITGFVGSSMINRVLAWRTFVPPETVLLAVVFSAGVGIFFGYYPARQAARLDPIEALRYE